MSRFTHEVVSTWHGHVLDITRIPGPLPAASPANVLVELTRHGPRFAPGVDVHHDHGITTATLHPLRVTIRPCTRQPAIKTARTLDTGFLNTLAVVAGVCALLMQVARDAPPDDVEDTHPRAARNHVTSLLRVVPPRPHQPMTTPAPRTFPTRTAHASPRARPAVPARKPRAGEDVLALLRGGGGALGRVLNGPADARMAGALAGLRGTATAELPGFAAVDTRGTGPGGGGGTGVVGLGQLGSGDPRGGGVVLAGDGPYRARQEVPVVRVVTGDALTREEVSRVMGRAMSRFRHCYERALQGNPALAGRISVEFTVGSTGSVDAAAAGEDTLDHADVQACVLRVTRSLRFPEPRGGGQVNVTWPLVFSSAG